jgi:replication factor A1
MATTCASEFTSGNEISNKGHKLIFLKDKEMPNNKVRLCMKDGTGVEIGNIISNADNWKTVGAKAGSVVEIVSAKLLSLKNGKPAYMVKVFKLAQQSKTEDKKPKKPTVLGVSSSQSGNCQKLTSVTPYASNWEVEVVVCAKQPPREWNNARGSGKIQNCIIQDDSGKMQLTLWKQHCDKFAFMEEGKVYRVTGCQLKPADKKWNKTGTDYEMHSTESMAATESVAKIEINYNFVKLNEINNQTVDVSIDAVGLISEVEEAREITFQASQRTSFVRNLTIVDDSGTAIRITIWGKQAEDFLGQAGMAIEFSGAVVSEYQSVKNLKVGRDTSMRIRDQMDEQAKPETLALFSWWNSGGSSQKFEGAARSAGGSGQQNFATIKTLKECFELGTGEQADYVDCRIWTTFFNKKENCWYRADPETKKKAIENGDGTWSTVDGKSMDKAAYRMILQSMKISDTTDECWANAFHDEGELLLMKSIEEVVQAQEDGKTDELFANATFKEWLVRMKIKEEYYQDSPRKKYTVVKCAPVNHEEYCKYLEKQLLA